MNFLTLAFDFVTAIGGVYILVGLTLHLIEAWQSCAAVVAVPVPETSATPSRLKRNALERPINWERRLSLPYGGEQRA